MSYDLLNIVIFTRVGSVKVSPTIRGDTGGSEQFLPF